MQGLINKVEELKKSKIKTKIAQRVSGFKAINKKSNEDLFSELCFCILTANFNAEKTIKIQNEIEECFLSDNQDQLENKLRIYGHRFPNKRSEYIHKARTCKDKLNEVVSFHDKKALREWMVNNVKGLGYKEASHFLRNIGFDDYAIIDFHIIDLLVRYSIIERPKTITKNKYLEIEKILEKIAQKTNLTLAELDLYLWYMETGKILK